MRPEAHAERALDPQALEQAADWLVLLSERPTNAADLLACERWRALNPENERAWARAQRLIDLVAAVPTSLARPVLGRGARVDRRAAIKHLLGVGALLPAGWLAWKAAEPSMWDRSLATRVGERRQFRLPDQGTVELDTDTRLDLSYAHAERLLRLRSGQILVQTAPDFQQPFRPFRVATAHGLLEALGTRFDVRVEEDRTRLSVLEGAVQATPALWTQAGVRVEAGQSIWMDARGRSEVTPIDRAATAWVRGMFAADEQPLAGFVREIARYRRGILRCDRSVADLKISGAFPLDDTDRVLAMLMATYPVAVERRAQGWWTTIVART